MSPTTTTVDQAFARVQTAIEQVRDDQDLLVFTDTLKSVHNEMMVTHARKVLTQAFPQHELAIFTRSWDEDRPRLQQLLAAPGATDYDSTEHGGHRPDWMSSEQWSALGEAERAIVYMGSDEEIHEHLDHGETEHADWTEFQLPLKS